MHLFLSSYKLGDKPQKFRELFSTNLTVGYIPNALDSKLNDAAWLAGHMASDMAELSQIGLVPELFDLKNYFGKSKALTAKLATLGGVWISGGNVFVLAQAMKLSGFDMAIKKRAHDSTFVYGGYSAGCCVLSSQLDAYAIVDDPMDFPYAEIQSTPQEGLSLIDFIFLPHFESAHSESAGISQEVAYCQKHNLPYKTLRDGDVFILE